MVSLGMLTLPSCGQQDIRVVAQNLLVLPSIAGAESVLSNHGADMVGDPKATWGVTRGNPIWEEMLEAAQMTRPTFLLNVTMNREKAITGVFAANASAIVTGAFSYQIEGTTTTSISLRV